MSGYTRSTPITDTTPCYVLEGSVGNFYPLSHQEAITLVNKGVLVEKDESGVLFDTTALVWDDLDVAGDRAHLLLDLLLGRPTTDKED